MLRGVLGGYRDWREFATGAFYRESAFENIFSFQCPAIYNALKRNADGLRDPVTGEFNGISAADEIEGTPAYIPPKQHERLLAQDASRHWTRQ